MWKSGKPSLERTDPPAPTANGNARFYLPELDGLRFLAFLLVFLHHSPSSGVGALARVQSIGWIGVDLFFALSALLFVRLLNVEFRVSGTIGILRFYLRRGLRIYPLYFVFCAALIGLSYVSKNSHVSPWRIFGLLSFTDNLFAAYAGYNPLRFAPHLWTISYEEQFYLAVPLVSLFLFRARARAVVVAILGTAALLWIARGVFVSLSVPHPAIWVLPLTHFESILLGIVIGLEGLQGLLSRVPTMALIASISLSVFLINGMGPIEATTWKTMLTYPLIGVATSLLVYVVLRIGRERWMKWLSVPPLVFLGKISYGLYVFHLLGITIGRKCAEAAMKDWPPGRVQAAALVASLAVTIAMAIASYFIIERPFLRVKKRFETVQSRPL